MNETNDGIYIGPKSDTPGATFHEKRDKPALLRNLAEDYRQQSYWETPYYFSFLDKCLEGIPLQDKVCLDVGCGDGRFAEYLIKRGARKIICIDSDYESLKSLLSYSEEKGFRESLTLIQAGAENIPLPPDSVDVAIAIGVFYYLGGDYERGIESVYEKIKKDGILISSEPNLEGLALRSLLFDSLGEMISIFQDGVFREKSGDISCIFPLHSTGKIESFYETAGFKLIQRHAISLFHQLVRILYLRGNISDDELDTNRGKLREVFDYLDREKGQFTKTWIYGWQK